MLESEYIIDVITNIKFFLLTASLVSWAAVIILALITAAVWIDEERSEIELGRMKKLLKILVVLSLVASVVLIFMPWTVN